MIWGNLKLNREKVDIRNSFLLLLVVLIISILPNKQLFAQDPPPDDLSPVGKLLWDAAFNPEIPYEEFAAIQYYRWLRKGTSSDSALTYKEWVNFIRHPYVYNRIVRGDLHTLEKFFEIREKINNEYEQLGLEYDLYEYLSEEWKKLEQSLSLKNQSQQSSNASPDLLTELQAKAYLQNKYPALPDEFSQWDYNQKREYHRLVDRYSQAQTNRKQQLSPQFKNGWLNLKIKQFMDKNFEKLLKDFFKTYLSEGIRAFGDKYNPIYLDSSVDIKLLNSFSSVPKLDPYNHEKTLSLSDIEKAQFYITPTQYVVAIIEGKEYALYWGRQKFYYFQTEKKVFSFFSVSSESSFHLERKPFYSENNYGLTDFDKKSTFIQLKFDFISELYNKADYKKEFLYNGAEQSVKKVLLSYKNLSRYLYETRLDRNIETIDEVKMAIVGWRKMKNFPPEKDIQRNSGKSIWEQLGIRKEQVAEVLNDNKKTDLKNKNSRSASLSSDLYEVSEQLTQGLKNGSTATIAPKNTDYESSEELKNLKSFQILKHHIDVYNKPLFFIVQSMSYMSQKKSITEWQPMFDIKSDLELRALIPILIDKKGIALPSPIGHELSSIKVMNADIQSEEYVLGRDFKVYAVKGKQGYFIKALNNSVKNIFIDAEFKRNQSSLLKLSEVENISVEKLAIVTKKLLENGYVELAKNLSSVSDLKTLIRVFARSNLYSYQEGSWEKQPISMQDRFYQVFGRNTERTYLEYSNYLYGEKLAFQCDGSNFLLSEILNDTLQKSYKANYVTGFVEDKGFLNLVGHANVEIYDESQKKSLYRDGTPVNLDPRDKQEKKNVSDGAATRNLVVRLLKSLKENQDSTSKVIADLKPKGKNPGSIFLLPRIESETIRLLSGDQTLEEYFLTVESIFDDYQGKSSSKTITSFQVLLDWINEEKVFLERYIEKQQTQVLKSLAPELAVILNTKAENFIFVLAELKKVNFDLVEKVEKSGKTSSGTLSMGGLGELLSGGGWLDQWVDRAKAYVNSWMSGEQPSSGSGDDSPEAEVDRVARLMELLKNVTDLNPEAKDYKDKLGKLMVEIEVLGSEFPQDFNTRKLLVSQLGMSIERVPAEFKKFFAAIMIVHLVHAVFDKGTSTEKFVDLIAGLPTEAIHFGSFSAGAALGSAVLYDLGELLTLKILNEQGTYIARNIKETVSMNAGNKMVRDALLKESTLRAYMKSQVGMYAGTVLNILLYERGLSAGEVLDKATQTQVGFMIAGGITRGVIVRGAIKVRDSKVGKSFVSRARKLGVRVAKGVYQGSKATGVTGVVVLATELLIADPINRWFSKVKLSGDMLIESWDSVFRLEAYLNNKSAPRRATEDPCKETANEAYGMCLSLNTVQVMDGYMSTIVYWPLYQLSMEYMEKESKLDGTHILYGAVMGQDKPFTNNPLNRIIDAKVEGQDKEWAEPVVGRFSDLREYKEAHAELFREYEEEGYEKVQEVRSYLNGSYQQAGQVLNDLQEEQEAIFEEGDVGLESAKRLVNAFVRLARIETILGSLGSLPEYELENTWNRYLNEGKGPLSGVFSKTMTQWLDMMIYSVKRIGAINVEGDELREAVKYYYIDLTLSKIENYLTWEGDKPSERYDGRHHASYRKYGYWGVKDGYPEYEAIYLDSMKNSAQRYTRDLFNKNTMLLALGTETEEQEERDSLLLDLAYYYKCQWDGDQSRFMLGFEERKELVGYDKVKKAAELELKAQSGDQAEWDLVLPNDEDWAAYNQSQAQAKASTIPLGFVQVYN